MDRSVLEGDPVSYTHLDVYKRQRFLIGQAVISLTGVLALLS